MKTAKEFAQAAQAQEVIFPYVEGFRWSSLTC